MKVTLIAVGKTDSGAISALADEYQKRLSRYCSFTLLIAKTLTKSKNLSEKEILDYEAKEILKHLNPKALVIALDDKGQIKSSVEFAQFIGQKRDSGVSECCFLIGGAYGFSSRLEPHIQAKLSLSKMTFTHQMVRPIFLEQLYRAYTILNHEPYHHE